MIPTCQILCGDACEKMAELPAQCVQMCVTSPPYFCLRDYGVPGQIGLENSVDEYVAKMVEVFREVKRVLRDDGTLWLNLGDSYFNYRPGCTAQGRQSIAKHDGAVVERSGKRGLRQGDIKEKDLMGIPWHVAFALQAHGWYLRSEIIWHKRNCMPESVTDRPTRNHEQIFLLTKSQNYYYDNEAIKEPYSPETLPRQERGVSDNHKYSTPPPGQTTMHTMNQPRLHSKYRGQATKEYELALAQDPSNSKRRIEESILNGTGANKRTVWTVATTPYPDAHFATYPPALIKPCILAGSRMGDTVLDCFAGSGTTGEVAIELGRNCILIELNPAYIPLIKARCDTTPALL